MLKMFGKSCYEKIVGEGGQGEFAQGYGLQFGDDNGTGVVYTRNESNAAPIME